MRFFIVVTGYNCRQYVQPCWQGLLKQGQTWRAVFIDDGSTDGTGKEIETIAPHPKFLPQVFTGNTGAAKRRYDAIHQYAADDDVVLLLGMDDELLPGCLDRIAKEYEAGKWMTYGNWVNQNKVLFQKDLHFPPEAHTDRSYRKYSYRSTAPNTFYGWLFKRIPEDDFKIDGKWIEATTESPAMFACLEMCGQDRIGVITEPIYFYRERLPGGTLRRLGHQFKYDIYGKISGRDKKELVGQSPLYRDSLGASDGHSDMGADLPALVVTDEVWNEKVLNLINRRGTRKDRAPQLDLYRELIKKVHIGKSVLDVGCGRMYMKECLAPGIKYYGLDAFPICGEVIPGAIEEFTGLSADTVLAFAVMDNCRDFRAACANMKAIATKNVVILTALGLPPSKEYHTHRLELSDFRSSFNDWTESLHKITDTLYLLEYARP